MNKPIESGFFTTTNFLKLMTVACTVLSACQSPPSATFDLSPATAIPSPILPLLRPTPTVASSMAEPSPSCNKIEHIVQPGDTLISISRQYNLAYQTIAQNNQIPSPYILNNGRKLFIRESCSSSTPPSATATPEIIASPSATTTENSPTPTATSTPTPTSTPPAEFEFPWNGTLFRFHSEVPLTYFPDNLKQVLQQICPKYINSQVINVIIQTQTCPSLDPGTFSGTTNYELNPEGKLYPANICVWLGKMPDFPVLSLGTSDANGKLFTWYSTNLANGTLFHEFDHACMDGPRLMTLEQYKQEKTILERFVENDTVLFEQHLVSMFTDQ